MRIIILGAGQVGSSLAENLVLEGNDITLVDEDPTRLQELHHKLDIKTINGCASYPDILVEAGIEQADMLIAVTSRDEVNMIACQIAYSLFRTPTKIARIRSENYYGYPNLFTNHHIPVDVIISPEQLITDHIINLIEHPGATQILDFAQKKVFVTTLKLNPQHTITGQSREALEYLINPDKVKILAHLHQDAWVSDPGIPLATGDEMLFISTEKALEPLLHELGCNTHPVKRIMIAGGGRVGLKIAKTLELHYHVKIIESNPVQAQHIVQFLHRSTVLQGDAGDKELLLSENIEFTDIFCAVTNDDETNIMSCLQAKKLGARHVMCLINRSAYTELINDSNIDYSISPQKITIGSILTKLRQGNMIKVSRLKEDYAEIIELVVYGDQHSSRVAGKTIAAIALPEGAQWACIVRNDTVLMPEKDLIIETGDHVIVLLLNKRALRPIESLFQVSLAFTQ